MVHDFFQQDMFVVKDFFSGIAFKEENAWIIDTLFTSRWFESLTLDSEMKIPSCICKILGESYQMVCCSLLWRFWSVFVGFCFLVLLFPFSQSFYLGEWFSTVVSIDLLFVACVERPLRRTSSMERLTRRQLAQLGWLMTMMTSDQKWLEIGKHRNSMKLMLRYVE